MKKPLISRCEATIPVLIIKSDEQLGLSVPEDIESAASRTSKTEAPWITRQILRGKRAEKIIYEYLKTTYGDNKVRWFSQDYLDYKGFDIEVTIDNLQLGYEVKAAYKEDCVIFLSENQLRTAANKQDCYYLVIVRPDRHGTTVGYFIANPICKFGINIDSVLESKPLSGATALVSALKIIIQEESLLRFSKIMAVLEG